jgi:hypothetical protein
MKLSLLDLTQNILSSLNSDNVNSYTDTTESMQVAEIIRTVYFNIINRAGLPDQDKFFQLDASTDTSLPVLMYRPDNVDSIKWLKYYDTGSLAGDSSEFIHDLDLDITTTNNTEPAPPAYKEIKIIPIKDFVDMVNRFNNNEPNVVLYTFAEDGLSFNLCYKDDLQPRYCTVVSNYYVLFDSFDNTVDSTLQSSKTMCFGQTIPTFIMEDGFIPELDDKQFPLLLNEAKSLAFLELKQTVHSKAEQETRRQWSSVQKDKSVVDKPSYFDQLPNYGRRGGRWL